jgi:spermidine synthase
MASRQGFAIASGLLFGSGASSLVFQILWIKQLSLVVGVEVHAVAAAVSAFFLGLALGNYGWGRLSERINHPLRLYAAVEIGVAIVGVGATLALARSAPVFARLEDVTGILAWTLPFLLIGLPAALMGGTLPILLRSIPQDGGTAVAGGRLYAANTAGAVVGALLSSFALIPLLGVVGSSWAAASISALAGFSALFADRMRPSLLTPVAFDRRSMKLGRDAFVGLALYGMAGALALGYEIVWSQALAPFVSTRVFAFSTTLATYLAGLALGSMLFARLQHRLRNPGDAFGPLIAAAGLAALLGTVALGPWLAVPQTAAEFAVRTLTGSDLAGMCARFAVAALAVVFPTTLLLGAALPAALNLIARDGGRSRVVGMALAANTFGGVVGAIATGFLLIPHLGVFSSLGVLAVAAALIGLAALIVGDVRGRMRTASLAIGLAALTVALVAPRDRLAASLPQSNGSAILFYEEGQGGAVAVIEQGLADKRFRRLYIQSVSNSGDAMPSLRYMRLQALLPLAIHNGEPRSAMVIGYGTGVTAGALLRYPDLQRRVVAELLPEVLHAAPLFRGAFGAAGDPRLEVRLRDGRRELQRSDERYDLITLEPPPPSAAGVVNLYSNDFYQLAASRLNRQGILAQWLPLPTQNESDTQSLVRSFLDVFPHVSLWTTELHETLLIGSPDPIALDLARIRERFAKPDVSAALGEIGVASAEAMLATYVMGREGLERFAADAAPVTDDQPRIEYAAWLRPSDFGLVLPDLMNQREEPPVVNADAASLATVAEKRVELLTFYHAGINAFAGNRSGWAEDMRSVRATDADNPYYRWFDGP